MLLGRDGGISHGTYSYLYLLSLSKTGASLDLLVLQASSKDAEENLNFHRGLEIGTHQNEKGICLFHSVWIVLKSINSEYYP